MSVEIDKVKNKKLFPSEESEFRLKKRRLADRWASWVVAAGGFTIIVSILAILLFILTEIVPLFETAKVTQQSTFSATKILPEKSAGKIILAGMDENQEIGYILTGDGLIQFFSLVDLVPRESFQVERSHGARITASWQSLDGKQLVLATESGEAVEVSIRFNSTFYEGVRTYKPSVSEKGPWQIEPERKRITQISFAGDPEASMGLAIITAQGDVRVYLRQQTESLFGGAEVDSVNYQIEKVWSGQPSVIALDSNIRNMYVGSANGKIYHWNVASDAAPEFVTSTQATKTGAAGITALRFLIGDRTLMVGDASGNVSAWFLVRDASSPSGWRLTKIHQMAKHKSAITALRPSARRKGFISGDRTGNLKLQYTTSERMLASFATGEKTAIRLIGFAPKANGALVLSDKGEFSHWRINNPHPESGFKAFFGKVWYEGYEKPEYVWQSTGGSDDYEPKLSLVPLIFGSLKGTLYTLIIALPLAIFGALYTSQFMHPALKNKIKPAVEIMAALPSVVLGFLAGLWLAPRIDNVLPAMLTMAVVLPLFLLISALVWRQVPSRFRNRFRPGIEGLLAVPVMIVGILLALWLNGIIESTLFSGDFKSWLFHTFALNYDQRNALVVGIAMGFAVIPIIYTISEDALSNVPRNLISGSLALGATRWQTAIKVVLPTAAAGIFSAIMIGFGRAVGETMIVLMATGNTPIMDWNIFNGFRTLSANIAVEIPEAPVGGTLYRVLFLSAMLLFIITFLVNTVAEVVRNKLRQKYQKL